MRDRQPAVDQNAETPLPLTLQGSTRPTSARHEPKYPKRDQTNAPPPRASIVLLPKAYPNWKCTYTPNTSNTFHQPNAEPSAPRFAAFAENVARSALGPPEVPVMPAEDARQLHPPSVPSAACRPQGAGATSPSATSRLQPGSDFSPGVYARASHP